MSTIAHDPSIVYMDYNASSPLDERVLEAMMPHLSSTFGNASSLHTLGRQQTAAVDTARGLVAELVRGPSAGVVFTAGATEANNLALKGIVEGASKRRTRVLVSAGEHDSVRQAARWLADRGLAKVDTVPLTHQGSVDLDGLDDLLGDDVLLVSIVAANSETGVLNPIEVISERVHEVGGLFHCDATQWIGRLGFNMRGLGADLVSLSGHKICGPAGVGALVANRDARKLLRPLLHGGGQETGLRSGSHNVPGIVGLGAAAYIAEREWEEESTRISVMRDRLSDMLRDRLSGMTVNGDPSQRLPNTANLSFAGADADAVLIHMHPVAVSTGSACHSRTIEPSPTLMAMGLNRTAAFEAIRFSLGRFTTETDVKAAIDKTTEAVGIVRSLTSRD